MLKEDLKPREFDEDMVEHAAEILLEAEDIKKNTMLMSAVEQHLANKKKKITSLEDLKKKANDFVEAKQKSDKEDQV